MKDKLKHIKTATTLYEQNEALVAWSIKKYTPKFIMDEDVWQNGREGLWKACLAYKPEKYGTKFSTFATRCIYSELMRPFREERTKKRNGVLKVSLNEPINLNENMTLEDVLINPSGDIEDSGVFLSEFITKLPELDRKLLYLHSLGLSQQEIAQQLGITQSWCSKKLIKLREAYLGCSE